MISTDDSFSSENKLYSPKENKINSYLNSNFFNKPKNSYKKNKFEIFETDYNENSEQQLKYRTELCKFYEMNGFCKYSSDCIFAHGKENLRENLCKKSGYKKRLCVNFFQKGFCMYGNRCQFSHSLKQEKNLNNNKRSNFSYKNYLYELENLIFEKEELIKKKHKLNKFKKITNNKKKNKNDKNKCYFIIIKNEFKKDNLEQKLY